MRRHIARFPNTKMCCRLHVVPYVSSFLTTIGATTRHITWQQPEPGSVFRQLRPAGTIRREPEGGQQLRDAAVESNNFSLRPAIMAGNEESYWLCPLATDTPAEPRGRQPLLHQDHTSIESAPSIPEGTLACLAGATSNGRGVQALQRIAYLTMAAIFVYGRAV